MRRCSVYPASPKTPKARLRPPLPGGVVRGGRWHSMGGTIKGRSGSQGQPSNRRSSR